MIILVVLIAKGAGSVAIIVNSLPAFYAYLPTSMLPITLGFFAQADISSTLLGSISLGYTVILMVFGRHMNRTLLESLKIRYENQRLLKETQDRKQIAETANDSKSRFLAAASHDLRQPIHALSLLLNVLEQEPDRQDAARVTRKMRHTLDSLEQLLNSLLDISRLDAGSIEVRQEPVDLLQLCENLEEEFQLVANEKGLSLTWPKQSLCVVTDTLLLEQILRNLVSNAIRYTPSGWVNIGWYRQGHEVLIEISDSGPGIAKEQQQAIFKEFYQVGNSQRNRQQGLGLGLAIVQRITQLLGTRIKLDSVPEEGSCFSFALPFSHETIARKSLIPTTRIDCHQGNECVVGIIEDDQMAGEAIKILLESWCYYTLSAASADHLLQQAKYQDRQLHIVISDLQLSDGKDGITEVGLLREKVSLDLPALIITGDIRAETLQGLQSSKLPVLHKPVAPARLRAFLRNSAPETV